jgi:hypothetical protein
MLERSLARVHESISSMKGRLQACLQKPIPRVSPFYFDDSSAIMFVRQHAWVLRETRELFLRMHQKSCEDLRRSMLIHSAILSLFVSRIIPKNIVCRVNHELLCVLGAMDDREQQQLRRLQSLVIRMDAAIPRLPRARWSRSFPEFLAILASHCQPDPVLLYFPPGPMEQSLARYFFNPESPHRSQIDKRLLAICEHPRGTAAFGDLASAMVAEHSVCEKSHSAILLVFFRMLFNRYYELKPHVFAPKVGSHIFMRHVRDLSVLEASEFSIPWDLIPAADHSIAVGVLFGREPGFRIASAAFSTAIFEPNPLDQLYRIQQSLSAIHTTVVAHRTATGYPHPTEMLSFDEQFALFCGILMAAESPDASYLQWSIAAFAPRAGLAPAFEYAAANLEALVSHVRRQWDTAVRLREVEKAPSLSPDAAATL